MFSAICLSVILVAVVSANEMQDHMCEMAKTKGGMDKLLECAKKAPQRAQDIPKECKEEVGAKDLSDEEFIKKVCGGDPDMAKKNCECNEKKFMDEMEKDEKFIENCGPFMVGAILFGE